MSDNTPAPLVANSLYNMHGRVMIALDHERLIPITAPKDGDTYHLTNAGVELIAHSGDAEWRDRMIKLRNEMATDLENERRRLTAVREHLDNLGQAILEQAIERDWCSEYDEFAEEWDLPPRKQDFEVTVTIQVSARDADSAEGYVLDNFGLSDYSDDVIIGPHVSADVI